MIHYDTAPPPELRDWIHIDIVSHSKGHVTVLNCFSLDTLDAVIISSVRRKMMLFTKGNIFYKACANVYHHDHEDFAYLLL